MIIVVAYETMADADFVGRIPIVSDSRLKDPAKIKADKEKKKDALMRNALHDPFCGWISGCRMREVGKDDSHDISKEPWHAFEDFGDVTTMLVFKPSLFLRMALIAGSRNDNTFFAPHITKELRTGMLDGKCTDPIKTIFGTHTDVTIQMACDKLGLKLNLQKDLEEPDPDIRLRAQEAFLTTVGELYW